MNCNECRELQHGSHDMRCTPFLSLRLPAHARQDRWGLSHEGQFLGLFSPDRSCFATFFLRPEYSIDELLEDVEGPGFLVLKGGPDEPIALSIRGVTIAMIHFDRPVKWSSSLPRWIDITRRPSCELPVSGEPCDPTPPGGPCHPERTRSPGSHRTEFDGRCDPRDQSRRAGQPRKRRASSK